MNMNLISSNTRSHFSKYCKWLSSFRQSLYPDSSRSSKTKENEGYIIRSSLSSDCGSSQRVVRPGFRSPLHPSEIHNIESFSITLTGVPKSDIRLDEWDLDLQYQLITMDNLGKRWQQHESEFAPLSISDNANKRDKNIIFSSNENCLTKGFGEAVNDNWGWE